MRGINQLSFFDLQNTIKKEESIIDVLSLPLKEKIWSLKLTELPRDRNSYITTKFKEELDNALKYVAAKDIRRISNAKSNLLTVVQTAIRFKSDYANMTIKEFFIYLLEKHGLNSPGIFINTLWFTKGDSVVIYNDGKLRNTYIGACHKNKIILKDKNEDISFTYDLVEAVEMDIFLAIKNIISLNLDSKKMSDEEVFKYDEILRTINKSIRGGSQNKIFLDLREAFHREHYERRFTVSLNTKREGFLDLACCTFSDYLHEEVKEVFSITDKSKSIEKIKEIISPSTMELKYKDIDFFGIGCAVFKDSEITIVTFKEKNDVYSSWQDLRQRKNNEKFVFSWEEFNECLQKYK